MAALIKDLEARLENAEKKNRELENKCNGLKKTIRSLRKTNGEKGNLQEKAEGGGAAEVIGQPAWGGDGHVGLPGQLQGLSDHVCQAAKREERLEPFPKRLAPKDAFRPPQNKIVEQCKKLQLQGATMAKFVDDVLVEKERNVVSSASRARAVLIRRLNLVRAACDSEEQRLLDVAHMEEERAHQSILTQRAHWKETLQKLEALWTYMVAVITDTDDHGLVQAEEEIFGRMEAAEGISQPQELEKLNFNPHCIQSPLVSRFWALAVLSQATDEVHIDERTVSPLLALSEDKKTLTFSPKKAPKQLDGPARFNHWPNALAKECFSTGTHAWRVRVAGSCAYKLGVAGASLQRKGAGPEARLGYNPASWVFSHYNKEFQFSHANVHQTVELLKCPAEIGVLVDLEAGALLFYDPESGVILHAHHGDLTGPVYPAVAVADQSISLL